MATEEILNAIPHRPPFLFVDEVVERGESTLTAKRHISESEYFFEGHYPGNPIMPGVLISEAVFQTGGVYFHEMLAKEEDADPDIVPVLTKIGDARFRTPVYPGDDIFITVKFKEKAGQFMYMDGSVKNGKGKRVMNISFCVAFAKTPKA